ncbi:hypothetical protein AXE80_07730 [Wenyingzhuangia fucanilytica]|uniref:Uncharacterized protein n=1 Tax=Wenyingzhuangia fucanilytica TaxID=1790137 RepID=A0A1B1Y5W6_9FLAO|nr:hypothetical protein [Wenyingzhuangia fucanilytica]ANW96172.1 hypothetical protein AXE80_07730 [Wenyingzhuangia fucanilytica]
MDTINNIVVFDGSLELHNPDLKKYDRSKAIVERVLRFLKNRDKKIIRLINKENAILYINRYSGTWKIQNASTKLINRIFG